MPKLPTIAAAIALVALARPALADEESLAADAHRFPDPTAIPVLEAVVVVRDFGEFRLRFHRDAAPNHVAHFLTLAATGYFDGMTFHRVIPRLLIQIGDPNSKDEDLRNDGPGGPNYRLPPEPNDLTHRRGTVSMAWRGEDPGSAGSQWFVCLQDRPALDGKATIFAEVCAGMETVDRIAQVTTHRNRNPRHHVVLERIDLVAPDDSSVQANEAPSLTQQDGATTEKKNADGERSTQPQDGVPR